jgi:ABC-type antimicrobial peptide transport system permease subunit
MGLIAAFILLIACINFMNLSTAQSVRRAKEIGVRKVSGANKRKIIVQFLGESLLIVFVAHVIAMIFVELLLPGFNNLTGKQLSVNYHSAGLYVGLISVVLFCGLLAGSYPALYLSSLKPLDIIKGVINKNPGNAGFRRVLVIFQFTLSIILIIST